MKPEQPVGQPSGPAPGVGATSASLLPRFLDGAAAALVAALDHVLQQNDWARAKLASFAGRVVRIGVDAPALPGLPPPQLLARITDGGLLEQMPRTQGDEPEAAVHMLLRPSVDAAFAFLRGGPKALSPHLRIEGEAMLAGVLGELRWDAEEDLSRISGDALARRIGGGIDSARSAARDLRARLESSAVAHLAGDAGQLVTRSELAALRASLDALEERVGRLPAQAGAGVRSTVRADRR
jgi:ubiquinone biosynthesis protein UbiJ